MRETNDKIDILVEKVPPAKRQRLMDLTRDIKVQGDKLKNSLAELRGFQNEYIFNSRSLQNLTTDTLVRDEGRLEEATLKLAVIDGTLTQVQQGIASCPLCLDTCENPCAPRCGHRCCEDCIPPAMDGPPRCAVCRASTLGGYRRLF